MPHGEQNFVCLCLAGDSYNNVTKSCETGKYCSGVCLCLTSKHW